MASHLFGTKPLAEPKLIINWKEISVTFIPKCISFCSEINFKIVCKYDFVQVSISLTHWGLVTPYSIGDLGQHWLRQWLVAWWHKAITRTNVDLSSVRSNDIHLRANSPQPSITEITWKIKCLKCHSNFPGASDLKQWMACHPIGTKAF